MTVDAPHPATEQWPEEPNEHGRGAMFEVVITIVAALVLAFVVQQYLVKPFKIPSGSMENTLHCGDRVLVDRVTYRFSDPQRKDVVVFHPPAGLGEGGVADPTQVASSVNRPAVSDDGTVEAEPANPNYIKRIIGLPGDTVEVKHHRAYINGSKLEEPYLRPIPKDAFEDSGSNPEWGPETVPKGTYLMLGDHRDNSADGREFGYVPRSFIIGKAFVVYWPPARFGRLPKSDPGGESSAADPKCLENAVPEGQTLESDG